MGYIFLPLTCLVICNYILKLFIYLSIYLFIYVATLNSLQDLSSLTRDWTWATAVKAQNPNLQATRELPILTLLMICSIQSGFCYLPLKSIDLCCSRQLYQQRITLILWMLGFSVFLGWIYFSFVLIPRVIPLVLGQRCLPSLSGVVILSPVQQVAVEVSLQVSIFQLLFSSDHLGVLPCTCIVQGSTKDCGELYVDFPPLWFPSFWDFPPKRPATLIAPNLILCPQDNKTDFLHELSQYAVLTSEGCHVNIDILLCYLVLSKVEFTPIYSCC